VLLAAMAGYALARLYLPQKKILITILGLVFFLPVSYNILPVFVLVHRLGLLNTLGAVILVGVGQGLLWATFFFYGYIVSLPAEIEEAAIVDGANVWQRFFWIILPLTKPMIVTQAIFAFMGSWNDFINPLVFTIGKPELRTLAVGVFAFVGENSRDWALMCAAASISLIPIFGLFFFVQRYFVEGLAGAIKG
jgi:raffinose/stachyose/melibiose transport system permease protein